MNIDKLGLRSSIESELKDILSRRTINKVQLSHFLSQCRHESKDFTDFDEDLNYSAKRLLEIFPKYFTSVPDAQSVVNRGHIAVANHLYNGRMGNNKMSNDGYQFRGGGCLHLTGRDNYTLFDATVPESIIGNTDLVRTKYKLSSAIWFFDVNKLWVICSDATPNGVLKVTKKVNGGINGLKERQSYFDFYMKIL